MPFKLAEDRIKFEKNRNQLPERKEAGRWYKLKSRYGITKEQYNEMFVTQQGRCAVCSKHQSEFKRTLSVDHCHKTGRVRGLLCDKCNTAAGWIENEIFVAKIKQYLGVK